MQHCNCILTKININVFFCLAPRSVFDMLVPLVVFFFLNATVYNLREKQTQISSIVSILRYNYIRDGGTEAERDGVIDGWN